MLKAKALLPRMAERHAALIELDMNHGLAGTDRAGHFFRFLRFRLERAFAIFAATVFDLPLRRSAWYCFQFLTCLPGTALSLPDLLDLEATHASLCAVARAAFAASEFSDVSGRSLPTPPSHR
jgi:hypothetical protein